MADNFSVKDATGATITRASKDVGGAHAEKTWLIDSTGADAIGLVSATPGSNTLLDRLKTINTTLGSPLQAGGTVVITGTASATQSGSWTVASTQSGSWTISGISGTISLPTGASTETSLTAMSAKLPASLGAKTGANSMSMVPASDATFAATQSGTWNVTNISGTVSLPTGASTETTLSAMSGKLPASLGGKTGATSLSIVPATDAYAQLPAANTSRLLSAAASTNATVVKASAGAIKSIRGHNARSSAVYLKLYNKATAPTVGTDTPVKTLYLPAAASFVFDFPTGHAFATGIGFALTTAAADADTGALASGDVVCLNVDYI